MIKNIEIVKDFCNREENKKHYSFRVRDGLQNIPSDHCEYVIYVECKYAQKSHIQDVERLAKKLKDILHIFASESLICFHLGPFVEHIGNEELLKSYTQKNE